MKRHYLSAIAAAVLVLAFAGPVAAWSGVGVTVTGDPGGTLVGTGEELVPELLVSAVLPARPAGDLGAKLQVTYSFDGAVIAVQDLYPYARGGPVAYSASSGKIASHPFTAGWHQARPSVLNLLVSWGLSPRAIGSAADRAPTAGQAGASGQAAAALDANDRVRPESARQAIAQVPANDGRTLVTFVAIAIAAAAALYLGFATRSSIRVRRPA